MTDTAPRKSLLLTIARWTIVVVIFGFIARSLMVNWDELARADLEFDIGLLLLSMVLLAAWMLGQALVWHLLTRTSQVAIPLPRALGAWFYSQLGKYLPGKVFLYLGRLHFYVKEGRRAGPVTVAFVVETVGNFAASILIVLVAVLGAEVPGLDRYRWLLVGGLVLLLVSLHPTVLGWVVGLGARLLRRQPFTITLGYRQLLGYVCLYALNWLLFGVALYVFIRSFYPLELDSILYLAGAFSFASMVGILAVFAPSGLGVREAILALFLGQVMPTAVALVVSVATRVWLTVIELAAAGVVYLWIRLRWHETPTFDDEGSMESGLEGIG